MGWARAYFPDPIGYSAISLSPPLALRHCGFFPFFPDPFETSVNVVG